MKGGLVLRAVMTVATVLFIAYVFYCAGEALTL